MEKAVGVGGGFAGVLLPGLAAARRVRAVCADALAGTESVYEAAVEVEVGVGVGGEGPAWVMLRETGVWVRGAAVGGAVRGAYRWRAAADSVHAVEVEHLRLGEDRPVWLCRVEGGHPGAAGGGGGVTRGESVAAHACGADRYAVGAEVEAGLVRVTWRVDGPAKRLVITSVYEAAAARETLGR